VEALDDVAAERDQAVPLVPRLDALGDDRESEAVPQVDGRADDRRSRRVGRRQLADEGLVDLHLFERQPVEVRERGVPAAEVVEREPHADGPELVQRLHRALRLAEQDALGDLEAQRRRRHVVLQQERTHDVREQRVEQVTGRQVHGHRAVVVPRAP